MTKDITTLNTILQLLPEHHIVGITDDHNNKYYYGSVYQMPSDLKNAIVKNISANDFNIVYIEIEVS